MALINKIDNIKKLSSCGQIEDEILSLITENIFDDSEILQEFTKIYFLLKKSKESISKMNNDDILKCINYIEKHFPSVNTKYHLAYIKLDADAAFKMILCNLKLHPSDGIISAITKFCEDVGNDIKYPDEHIVSHLTQISKSDLVKSKFFNFKTDNVNEQLLIKSCKVRSIMKGWSGKYDGDYKPLAIEVINSGIKEFIENMGLSGNNWGELFEIINTNDYIKKIIINTSPEGKKELLMLLIGNI